MKTKQTMIFESNKERLQENFEHIPLDLMMKFSFMSDGVIAYESVKPFIHGDEHYNLELRFFNSYDSDILDFDTVETLLRNLIIHSVKADTTESDEVIMNFLVRDIEE